MRLVAARERFTRVNRALPRSLSVHPTLRETLPSLGVATIARCACGGGCPRCKLESGPVGKMQVSQPGDPLEREADHVADQVMRMTEPPFVGSQPFAIEQTDSKGKARDRGRLQSKCKPSYVSTAANQQPSLSFDVPSIVEDALRSAGQPLESTTREFMEARFGDDFGSVKIHSDFQAAMAAAAIDSRAFTVSRDVIFGAGEYAPHSESGRRLLAHELTHVVQQGARPGSRAEVAMVQRQATKWPPKGGKLPTSKGTYKWNPASGPTQTTATPGAVTTYADVPQLSWLTTAERIARIATLPAESISQDDLESLAVAVKQLAPVQRERFLNFFTKSRKLDEATREGAQAYFESQFAPPSETISPNIESGLIGGVEPGEWKPPGKQPIPYYIGNEAHLGIAASYSLAHLGELVFTNFTPMATVLKALSYGEKPLPGKLSPKELDLKPDIVNSSRRHLYEIKPLRSLALAEARAAMYLGLFTAAGVSMKLGPVGEKGTFGVIPAPAGVYLFESLAPGTITYQYRQGRVVPVHKPVPETEKETQRSPRYRLQPLTPKEIAVVATAVIAYGTWVLFGEAILEALASLWWLVLL